MVIRMAMKVTEAISCGARRLHAHQHAGQGTGNDAGLARPAHEQQLLDAPVRTAVRQGAGENRERPRHQHEHRDHATPPSQYLLHQGEIDLGAEQDENEHAHDERSGLT